MKDFEFIYTGHEKQVRRLMKKYLTDEELSQMCFDELQKKVNELFLCYLVGEDWILIPRDKEDEFNKIAEWVCR